MTVPVSDRLSQLYSGNGVNTRFDFTFHVFDQEDATGIAVKHQIGADFETMPESLYTVTINEDNLGGHIFFKTAPTLGFEFYIAGETPLDQQVDITNYDNFYPDVLEKALDKVTAILQEWSHSLGLEKISRNAALDILDQAIQQQMIDQGIAMGEIDSYAKGLTEDIKNIVIQKGWLAEFIVDGDETQNTINMKSSSIFTPKYFGANGVNDKYVFNNTIPDNTVLFLDDYYNVDQYECKAKKIIGNNTDIHVDVHKEGKSWSVLIPKNSYLSDINFVQDIQKPRAWNRSFIGDNTTLDRVGFFNFKDTDDEQPNSWGLFLENNEDIVLNNPRFGNNSQADIAIVDNVRNVTIINAHNKIDDGVLLNLEPELDGGIENINIISGDYRRVSILEKKYDSYGIKSVNFIGVNIKLLEVRGGITNLVGCQVKEIKGNWENIYDFRGNREEYFGQIKIDNAILSKNLISNSNISDLSANDLESYWSIFSPVSTKILRKDGYYGQYLSINHDKSSYQSLSTRNYIDLPTWSEGMCVCIPLTYQVLNNPNKLNFEIVYIDFFDDFNNKIDKTFSVKGGRVKFGENSEWLTESVIFKMPPGAKKFKVALLCNEGSTLNVRKIGFHLIFLNQSNGNFNYVIDSYSDTIEEDTIYRNNLPIETQYGFNKNRVILVNGDEWRYYGVEGSYVLAPFKKHKIYAESSFIGDTTNPDSQSTFTVGVLGVKVGMTIKLSSDMIFGANVLNHAEIIQDGIVTIYQKNNSATAYKNNGIFNIIAE